MTNRITKSNLDILLSRINERAGHGSKPDYKTVGAYVLSYAYGGVKLEQITNEFGGVRTISTGGYGTKRELYNQMQAFLRGMSHAD